MTAKAKWWAKVRKEIAELIDSEGWSDKDELLGAIEPAALAHYDKKRMKWEAEQLDTFQTDLKEAVMSTPGAYPNLS